MLLLHFRGVKLSEVWGLTLLGFEGLQEFRVFGVQF